MNHAVWCQYGYYIIDALGAVKHQYSVTNDATAGTASMKAVPMSVKSKVTQKTNKNNYIFSLQTCYPATCETELSQQTRCAIICPGIAEPNQSPKEKRLSDRSYPR